MKKQILTLVFMASILSFTSCRETVKEETVVKEVEADPEIERTEVEVVEEEDEGILERAGQEVDEEVNKEINEEIDKIGDDN